MALPKELKKMSQRDLEILTKLALKSRAKFTRSLRDVELDSHLLSP